MKITLEIWDTAGQEKFKKIAPIYYRNAQAILIVFDLGKMDSFESVQKWMDEVEKFLPPDALKYIVGNKLDQYGDCYFQKDVDELITRTKSNIIYTSAKTGHNVNRLFRRVARAIAKRKLMKMEMIEQQSLIKLQIQSEEDKLNQFEQQKQCC